MQLLFTKHALGLYTQEAIIICGSKKYRRTAAIPYVPNAKLFDLETSDASNFKEYFKFEALYIILNESDSREYYVDQHERLFKLDNATSFTVEETTIRWFDGDPLGHFFIPDINAPLNAVGNNWYSLKLREFTEEHGQDAAEVYLSVIRRFAEFDETILSTAYAALDKQYSHMLKCYYNQFIQIRKRKCRKFLEEIQYQLTT